MADEEIVIEEEMSSEKEGVGTKIKNMLKKGGRFVKRNWKPFAAGIGTVVGGSLIAMFAGGNGSSDGLELELPSSNEDLIPEIPLENDITSD